MSTPFADSFSPFKHVCAVDPFQCLNCVRIERSVVSEGHCSTEGTSTWRWWWWSRRKDRAGTAMRLLRRRASHVGTADMSVAGGRRDVWGLGYEFKAKSGQFVWGRG